MSAVGGRGSRVRGYDGHSAGHSQGGLPHVKGGWLQRPHALYTHTPDSPCSTQGSVIPGMPLIRSLRRGGLSPGPLIRSHRPPALSHTAGLADNSRWAGSPGAQALRPTSGGTVTTTHRGPQGWGWEKLLKGLQSASSLSEKAASINPFNLQLWAVETGRCLGTVSLTINGPAWGITVHPGPRASKGFLPFTQHRRVTLPKHELRTRP